MKTLWCILFHWTCWTEEYIFHSRRIVCTKCGRTKYVED